MIIGALTLMLADSTLCGLVGRNKADTTYKIYPVACPQEEVSPYITTGLTGAEAIQCKGVGGQPEDETFDVVVWGDDYVTIDTIGRRVIQVLNNALGTAGGVTFKRLTFQTHKDGLDSTSKKLVRIVTFSGYVG